ncbi:NAD+ synthase [Bartonella sp. DGB1]|uniref:NAD+ synthase n=1 Tax=Bartonella sp. DGB1 TaxID=3239807 RepID=UPI003524DF46
MKIFLAQLNPTVGDIANNLKLALNYYSKAKAVKADIIVFSELFICGYSPQDLVKLQSFLQECELAIMELTQATKDSDTAILVGSPIVDSNNIYNAALLLDKGEIIAKSYKYHLPNYKEFSEKRIFSTAELPRVINFRDKKIAMPICEDIWQNSDLISHLKMQGVELLLVMNASPYTVNKMKLRHNLVRNITTKISVPLVYVNQIGAQDGLIFDGGSFVYNATGDCILQLAQFKEDTACYDLDINNKINYENLILNQEEANYQACVLGLRDYILKNNFKKVIVGLSGGIDSALSTVMAVDAIGAENVSCYMLPYKYTSDDSLIDAEISAKLLGVDYHVIPINQAVEASLTSLSSLFAGYQSDTTEENIQSRIRGVFLMALANKFNSLLITTGNKSELAVGYATLYGDMNGAYNPIKDLYKTEVYKLARWRNANYIDGLLGIKGKVIAENILTKEPSAELRDNQKDTDSLPPYDILDKILYKLIEEEKSLKQIISDGYNETIVAKIENLLYLSEYKRSQAAIGTKLTERSLGIDRQYPITNSYRDKFR